MTFTEEYHNVKDHKKWPEGPWNREPDKAVWIDEATGLDCMIVRNNAGALCGYVGVAPDHPWHEIRFNDCTTGCGKNYCGHSPAALIDTHGELTFSDRCQPWDEGPEHGICHIAQPGRPDPVWWFGFDCGHAYDLMPGMGEPCRDQTYRDLDYVQSEVAVLARQLKAVKI